MSLKVVQLNCILMTSNKSTTYAKSHTLDTSISAFLRVLSSLCVIEVNYCNAMNNKMKIFIMKILRPLFFKNLSHLIFHLLNYLRPLGY